MARAPRTTPPTNQWEEAHDVLDAVGRTLDETVRIIGDIGWAVGVLEHGQAADRVLKMARDTLADEVPRLHPALDDLAAIVPRITDTIELARGWALPS